MIDYKPSNSQKRRLTEKKKKRMQTRSWKCILETEHHASRAKRQERSIQKQMKDEKNQGGGGQRY